MTTRFCTQGAIKIKRFIVGTSGLVVFIAAFLFIEVPGNSIIGNALQNAGHTLIFALVTFLILRISDNISNIRSVILICLPIFLTGLLIELAQLAIGRGFSALDLVKNTIGVVAGVLICRGLSSLGHHRWLALLAGFTLILASLGTTLAYIVSDALKPSPPILTDFEQWGVEHRIRATGTVLRIDNHDPTWSGNSTKSAQIKYFPGLWPSVQMFEVYPEWHHYGCLKIRVFNPQETSVSIRIRVDDPDLGPEEDDHMTVRREVVSGESEVVIPLDEFRKQAAKGDHPGEPLMERIRSFMFYVYEVKRPVVLLIDDIELGCQ